jgi:hypothetical protein
MGPRLGSISPLNNKRSRVKKVVGFEKRKKIIW